jgi:hypothetical protein
MDGSPTEGWENELERWLEPFLAGLRRKAQRRWAPFYLKGLILPGERKSIEPMAARVAPADTQQLHHFVSTSPWPTAPLEEELVRAADRLVGGPDAVLVVDDTALVKQGRRSVGVKRQYCGQLGKRANCQSLVSLTLARTEVRSVSACACSCRGLGCATPAARGAGRARGVPTAEVAVALTRSTRSGLGAVRLRAGDAEYGRAAEFRRAERGRLPTRSASCRRRRSTRPT